MVREEGGCAIHQRLLAGLGTVRRVACAPDPRHQRAEGTTSDAGGELAQLLRYDGRADGGEEDDDSAATGKRRMGVGCSKEVRGGYARWVCHVSPRAV